MKQKVRSSLPSHYDPGYKRCPCLMHNRLYYQNERLPPDQEVNIIWHNITILKFLIFLYSFFFIKFKTYDLRPYSIKV